MGVLLMLTRAEIIEEVGLRIIDDLDLSSPDISTEIKCAALALLLSTYIHDWNVEDRDVVTDHYFKYVKSRIHGKAN